MKKKKNTTHTTAPQPVVVNQLIVKSPTRKVYDVGNWRTALQSADSGRPKMLFDLFDDICIDGILADAIEKRITAVLNAELTFQNDKGETVPELEAIIDTPDFELLIRQIMLERFYGRTAAEIICTPDTFHVEAIPPKHVNIAKRCIVIHDTDDKGIPYEGDSSLLVIGRERDYGLLLKATPYAIYKRGGFGDWSQWVELFGMPQRVGKYNSYDPESRRLLERAMEEAGSAPYIIIPKEAEVETKSAGNGNGASYNEFRQACNEEILITILGQTLTTVQGENGARSLGEVHKEVEEGKNRTDMRFVQRILNTMLMPMLEARGYPVSGGRFVFPKAAEALTVTDIVQLSEIMPIPQSYLHQKYSIPTPQDGEPIARRQPATFEPTDIEPPTDSALPGDDEPKQPIKNRDRNIWARLMDFFVQAPSQGASTSTSLTTNLSDNDFDTALIRRVATGKAAYFDATLFQRLSEDFSKALQTALRTTINNTDYGYDETHAVFVTALEQNLFHFSAAKTLAECQTLNQEFRKARNFTEFHQKAKQICGMFNKVWQRTEYDTAVLTAEAAATYQRLIKKANTFPYWQYVTAGDNRVREEHRQLNGLILEVRDPRWDKIYPPNGWNCRCRVKPLMSHEVKPGQLESSKQQADDFMETDEWEKTKKHHFDVNMGKRAEIFNKNQMYVRKFTDNAGILMDRVKPSEWGVADDYKSLIKKAAKETTKYEGTAADWWKLHHTVKDGKEVLEAQDYNRRIWYMERKAFDDHTTDHRKSRQFRTQYLDCIREVMNDPDEVWIGHDFKDSQVKDFHLTQWLYIKYYGDTAIVCVCKIQGERMNFKSWYELQNPRIRTGLLVYKK